MTDVFREAAHALVSLGRTLTEARAVRYRAADHVSTENPQPSNRVEVSNPTLDTVLDQRRWDLSTEVSLAEVLLEAIMVEVRDQDARLTAALARWNNERGDE